MGNRDWEKTKKSRKFNSKNKQGKEHEIEIDVTNESIIFKSEINNGIITKKYSNIYSFDTLKKKIYIYIPRKHRRNI
jgi:hypothetical protein